MSLWPSGKAELCKSSYSGSNPFGDSNKFKINRTKEITEVLIKEGKVTFLNRPEDIEAILELNKEMAKVRRDYKYKNAMSIKSAGETLIN